jgi:hypothetical protein
LCTQSRSFPAISDRVVVSCPPSLPAPPPRTHTGGCEGAGWS